MAAGTLAEWALSHPHPGAAWWHATPGVQALYGLAGCVAIVVVAKWLGQLWLQRPEPDETADE
jgi:hypothetical protein